MHNSFVKREKLALLIIVNLFIFHTLVNFYILDNSKIIRKFDEANYISKGIEFHQMLVGKNYKGIITQFLIIEPSAHPKLFSFIEGLVLTFLVRLGLQDISSMILFTNAIFFFILLFSVYGIGSQLYNQKIGLISSVFLSFCPIVFAHSRVSMLDFPLAAMVSLSFLFLLKTRNFSSFFYSLFSGFVIGLACLIKEPAAVFIVGPFSYYSFHSVIMKEKRRQRIISLIVTLLISLAVAGPVYFSAYNKMNPEICRRVLWMYYNDFGNFYYLKCFPLVYLGIIFSVVLFPLVLISIFNFRKINFFLFLWFAVPFLIFYFASNKNHRFLMPILPPLLLILTHQLFNSFLKTRTRNIYVALLICVVIFQYLLINFSSRFTSLYYRLGHIAKFGRCASSKDNIYSANRKLILVFEKETNIPNFGEVGLLSIYKDRSFELIERLIDIFDKETSSPDKIKKIAFTFDFGLDYALNYELKMRNLPFQVDFQQQFTVIVPTQEKKEWNEYFSTVDYVVDKADGGEKIRKLGIFRQDLKKSFDSNRGLFKPIRSIRTKDNAFLYVYRKI